MKLNRATLAEQIAESLLEQIRTQGLKSGEPLPSEAQLVVDFDVSRPVIREALKYLEGQGVIEIANGRGAILKPVTGEPLIKYFQMAVHLNQEARIELMEVRRGLEVESATLAAQRRLPDELEKLQEHARMMQEHLFDQQTYIELDVEFHEMIAACSHNEMLFHIIKSIRESSKNLIGEGLRLREASRDLARVQELHMAIFRAIHAGDPQGAGQAMLQHFNEAVSTLENASSKKR